MTPKDIKSRFKNLTVWRRGGERAPHKPLLALYAIARLLRCEPRMIPYVEIDRELGKLLMEFGPHRQSYHPEYPFWRLQNDGIWEVSPKEGLTSRTATRTLRKASCSSLTCWGSYQGNCLVFRYNVA